MASQQTQNHVKNQKRETSAEDFKTNNKKIRSSELISHTHENLPTKKRKS